MSGGAKHDRTSYTSGCRCDICKAANAEYARERRARAAALPVKRRADGTEITHGVSGYVNWVCRCETCTKAHTSYVQPAVQRYNARNPDKVRARSRRAHHRGQADTAPTATRHYYRWTGPELELASRTDLTAKEVALQIGRTAQAVRDMRNRLKSSEAEGD